MQASVSRAVAQEYEKRRFAAERERDARIRAAYAACPELEKVDQAISASGAELLLEAIDPGKPRRAAADKARLTARRQKILLANSLPDDFDQIRYICPLCHDTGQNGQQRCPCYRSVLIPLLSEHANLRALGGVSFETFDESLFSSKAEPDRYQSDLSPRQQIRGLKNACQLFVRDFNQPETRNLLFVGKPGTGKTFLMACIARSLLDQGRSALYMTAPQLISAISEYRTLLSTYNPDEMRLEKASALHDSIMTCDLLLIDDLGTEAGASSRYADLLGVIDGRCLPGLRTIISSNSEPSSLRDTYDERLLSRLVGGFAVYRFFGEDVRLALNRRHRRLS
jgi:DNA replication protein DnaC